MGGETEEEETEGFVCVFVRLVYVVSQLFGDLFHTHYYLRERERERREHSFHRR
jgi:hypothetical protein